MHKIPNILSALRILLIPILIGLIIISSRSNDAVLWLAFAIYVIASLTDWFDGFLARKYNFTTAFGALLDEIADKLFVISMVMTLIAVNYIEGWHILAVGIIIGREVAMPAFRQFLSGYHIKIGASIWGKLKTTVQMIALGLILLTPYSQNLHLYGIILLWVATALTVFSAADYVFGGIREYKKISKH